MNKEVFVIIHSYRVGDMILTNSLVQNIKRLYKNSHIVALASKQLFDLAKYQEGIDEVIIWDRASEHKSFFGMLKFVFKFPYKKIHTIFPIWGLDRQMVLARLLNPKYISACKTDSLINRFLRKTKYPVIINEINIQKDLMNYLAGITKEELVDVPLKFNVEGDYYNKFNLPENYIVLVPTSTRDEKELTNETFMELIEESKSNTIVLLGAGDRVNRIQEIVENKNYLNVINLFNKTTIPESADIIKHSQGVISVDTGLAHLTCALNRELLMVMYEKNAFLPDENMYKVSYAFNNEEFRKKYVEFFEAKKCNFS